MAGVGGLAEALRGGAGEGAAPPMPEEGAGGAMPIEEATAYLESKGIRPEEFDQLVAAVVAVIEAQGGGEEPPMPEEEMPADDTPPELAALDA